MTKIGRYIKQPTGYKAFVPEPFPPQNLIQWSDKLILLLSEAERAIGKLNAVEALVPDVNFFIFMYVKKEAALSSQIEGTQATLIDFMKAEAKLPDGDIPSDVAEIANYIQAMNYGMKRLKTLPLSLRFIREIHEKLLKGVRGQHKTPGEFRRTQNWIGGPSIQTAAFVPPSVHEMQNAMSDLEKFIHDRSAEWPPLVKAGLIHAQFETIHPFLDGNGRTGRLLIAFYLCKEGILSQPLLYLSDFFKRHRQDYYERLNRYRLQDGVEEWLMFFLEGIRTVSNEAAKTSRQITQLKEKHVKKVFSFGRNSETALKLLNGLFVSPVADAGKVAQMAGLSSMANVNNLIRKFVDAGILHEMTGKMRRRRFIYRDYVRLFSNEPI